MISIKFYGTFPEPLFSRCVPSYKIRRTNRCPHETPLINHTCTRSIIYTRLVFIFVHLSKQERFPGQISFLFETSHLCIAAEHGRGLLFPVTSPDPVTAARKHLKACCWQTDPKLQTANPHQHHVSPGYEGK